MKYTPLIAVIAHITTTICGAYTADAASRTSVKSIEMIYAAKDRCSSAHASCRLGAVHYEAHFAQSHDKVARVCLVRFSYL